MNFTFVAILLFVVCVIVACAAAGLVVRRRKFHQRDTADQGVEEVDGDEMQALASPSLSELADTLSDIKSKHDVFEKQTGNLLRQTGLISSKVDVLLSHNAGGGSPRRGSIGGLGGLLGGVGGSGTGMSSQGAGRYQREFTFGPVPLYSGFGEAARKTGRDTMTGLGLEDSPVKE